MGKALQFADDQTLVIVLSDHGFGSFQRGVNLNTLLLDDGLLALRDGARPGHDCRDFLLDVDWSRTSAYALGLGGIYLNLEGREAQGTVKAGSAETLKAAIAGRLSGLVDPARGTVAVRRVRPRQSVYSGPFVERGSRPAGGLRPGLPGLVGHVAGRRPGGPFRGQHQEMEWRSYH